MLNKDNVMEYLKGLIEIRKNLINAVKAGMYDYEIAIKKHNQNIGFTDYTEGFEEYANKLKRIYVDSLVFKYFEGDYKVELDPWFERDYRCTAEIDGFIITSTVTQYDAEMWGVDFDRKRVS